MENWICKLRDGRGWTQAQLARRIGTSQQQIDRLEKSERALSLEWIEKLARAFGVAPADVVPALYDLSAAPRAQVLGQVEAGAYKTAVEWEPEDRFFVAVPFELQYPTAPHFGLKVVGTSMNRVFPSSTILICVRLFDIQEEPRNYDFVIVHRRRDDDLMEATVKQLVIDEQGRHWLWPRSSDPAHQQPIEITPQHDAMADHDHLYIHAIVVGSIKPELRGRPPVTPDYP